ncbi:hypothetical protein K0028_12550 [Curtobacterium flaccumfaciens pv. flaccumfaciens]|uniref:WXG100 family type VII secretion target n=1 Tax=Curtobacterium flaccumfaciens TaxID=2035 RepID=UPI0021B0FAF3|nr:hypothetical protein [Curtobacterium flaccumfaciens]QYI96517.1 hypothetical protein K0028_12550 [Curtobacterium flaccumfaciens pv. flaccumfaciens]
MGRPSGWDVVDQGDDPVKGDPSTLRMMAREYQRISDAADDASTRLKSVKGSGWLTDWEGEAADVFVDAIEDTPSDLSKLVDSYELAATALSEWADTVDDTQYRADGALADAKDATGDLAAAQDRLADAQSTLSHYESASKDLSKVADEYPAGSDVPDGVDVPSPAQLRAASDNASVAQGSVSSAQGDISAAQSRIDAAKRLVADAKGDWQDAEQRTATKIGEAADAGLGKQSTWDKIFGSEAWETIVSVAKVVVAVGGIIAMIIPGPWTLIIAAIALVVLADTLYKMSKGEADGWDLAFSLLDCVPAGGAVAAAARTARLAEGATKLAALSNTAARVVGAGQRAITGIRGLNTALKTKASVVIERMTQAFQKGERERASVQGMGHSYFDATSYHAYYEAGDSTIGAPGGPFFLMPEEDALQYVHNPIDAMVQTGLAPSVRQAVMHNEPVYGIRFPLEGTSPRLPSAADAGGNLNYTPGGHTAVAFEEGHMINETREFVIDGGRPVPAGSEVFQLMDNGERMVVRRFG